MLKSPTSFPYVGSFALVEHEGGLTLARILARRVADAGVMVLVGLPLRDGAGGNFEIPETRLIDATPLTSAEQREFHDLDRALFGREQFRTPKQKADRARRDALKSRIMHGPILDRLRRFLPADLRFAA